ncbi:phytoene desaturase [Mycobacterium sp. BK086]|uniref:phytoene desaturase family protein n=1 Tax=Mycobacterium sp. BK086 TaxID=2512165 RepID=UPI001060879A|nr:phytoene desaturase family protein [Mycobacterium sp. BK086]TDO18629.1 phytoene desaturase [Mycobacterium sp. BK086]
MRKLSGATERVIVVGAGFAGLSAALHLAGRGRDVTVVEREPWPGGRAGRRDVGGYLVDTGPTVITMPDLIEEAFAAVGESTSQRVELLPVEPAYRAMFADDTAIDVHTDAERMATEVREFAGPREAAGYAALRTWLDELYRTEFAGFIAANFDSPLSMVTPQLARLAALGGFRKWETMVKRHIADPRLRRVFTFQSLYAGVAPRQALAVYAVIAYMDTISGVFFPRGGVRALSDGLAAAAQSAGVTFRYGSTVTGLDRTGDRVSAVITDGGERLPCDAVVLTTELPLTYQLLNRRPARLLPLRPAPSAVVMHLGCRSSAAGASALPHHSILFGDAWEQTFTDIITDGRLMRDPSLLVTCPTSSDNSLAPRDRELLYVLAPAPNLTRGRIDWADTAAPYAQSMIDTVQSRLLPNLRDDVELLHLDTPADWARQGMTAGTPFALAHTFAQTGPFRPANLVRGIHNAVLAGSSTTPGVGVPTTLISGRLAADRITGTSSRSTTNLDLKARH